MDLMTKTRAHTVADSPVGELTLVREGSGLVGLYFPGHWYPPDPSTLGPRTAAGFEQVEGQLADYFAGRRTAFDLELRPYGNEFQQRVWAMIAEIPYGETTTYGQIASALGVPRQAQAVGGAVGHNPLSIVIACHRVIGSDGRLTGYAGGLERKRHLLDLEGAVPTGLF